VMFQGNVVLEVLLLSGNDIGEDGARHLMIALAANSSLQYLGLNGSNMTCELLTPDTTASCSTYSGTSHTCQQFNTCVLGHIPCACHG
jgi:hypothetical protein